MALSSTTHWQLRTDGVDTNGGGAASLTISGNGVAVFTVNTAAAHTLVLTGS